MTTGVRRTMAGVAKGAVRAAAFATLMGWGWLARRAATGLLYSCVPAVWLSELAERHAGRVQARADALKRSGGMPGAEGEAW